MEKLKSWGEIFKTKKKVRASPSHPKQVTVLYLCLIPPLTVEFVYFTESKENCRLHMEMK